MKRVLLFIFLRKINLQFIAKNSRLISHPNLSRNACQLSLYGTTLNCCTVTSKFVPLSSLYRQSSSCRNLCTKQYGNCPYGCTEISRKSCNLSYRFSGLSNHCTTTPILYGTSALMLYSALECVLEKCLDFRATLCFENCALALQTKSSSLARKSLFLSFSSLLPQPAFKERKMSLGFSTPLVTLGFHSNPTMEIMLDQGMRFNKKINLTFIIFPHPL